MINVLIIRGAQGLTPMQKVWIGVGTSGGILVVIGIILGAVLGTQLNKHPQSVQNFRDTTQAPTTVTAEPQTSNDVLLNTDMILENMIFTDDLNDTNSEAFKDLANRVCEELKKALPQDEIDSADCSDLVFSEGSVRVRLKFRVVVKRTVTVTMISFANMVQTYIRIRFTAETSTFKARPNSISFKNLKICTPNPCKYSGKCIDTGDGEFKCQCKPGKYGKTCDDEITFCSCSGDTHCKTYDKLAIDYQGTCKFVLSQAKDKSFTVYLRNINLKGKRKVSWARYVELSLNNVVVRIGKLDPYDVRKPIAAWVNNVQVGLPFQNADLNIYKTGHTIVCRTNQGLIISYANWQARVGLPSNLKNMVTGLCGNFDGIKNNDGSTTTGENVLDRNNFGNTIGNSYVVEDNEKQPYSSSCKLSDDDVANPVCSGVDLKKALLLCQQIKDANGKFKTCASAMRPDDISDFSTWCEYDVKQTCDITVATLAVTIFIQSCFEFDDTLVKDVQNWKEGFNITKEEEFDDEGTCTGGKVSTTSGCENTCSNKNATSNCDLPDVMVSCSCPSDKVSFKDTCVEPSACGCIHTDGSAHFIGDFWLSVDCASKFTCSAGGKISRSLNRCGFGKTCSNAKCLACSPTNPCYNGGSCTELDASPGYSCRCSPGYSGSTCGGSATTCQGLGDAHYKTFDDFTFDYQGTRKYKLVQWSGDGQAPSFSIFGKNVRLKSSSLVSYVFYVEFSHMDTLVRITKAYKSSIAPIVVNVNYNEVEVPYNENNVTIMRKGNSIELSTHEGVVIVFSPNWQFKVKLSSYFFGRNLTGLCGNFDGMPGNDKTKGDGSIASGSDHFTWGRDLGDSFIIDDDPEDDEKLPTPTYSPPPRCDTADLMRTCSLISSTSGPFAKCLNKVPRDVITQREGWCSFDVQWTCDLTAALDSFSLISDICAESNVIVDWRTVLKQPCKCSRDDLKCYPIAPACIPSCQDPRAVENCQYPPLADVCACPEGKLLFKGRCVLESECGCVDEMGISHQIGDVWLTQNCRAFKCVRSNGIEPQQPACPNNTICRGGKCLSQGVQCTNEICSVNGGKCVLNRNGTYSCKCNPGFIGNRCQYREATCYCHGDIHCRSFDGIHLDYQGLCRFVLVNSTDENYPFTVYGKNVVRFQRPRVSWLLYVKIYYNGSRIQIGRESASDRNINTQVNDSFVTATPASFQGFRVYRSGNNHVFQSQDRRLQVIFGNDWTVRILLVSGAGGVEGFCGNNNMLRSDDYKLRSGAMPNDVNVKSSGKLIGDSYVDDITCSQPATTTPPPSCPAAQIQAATTVCGAISDSNGVFSACHVSNNNQSHFNATQSRLWCVFDFVETCQMSAVETALSAFAKLCIEVALANNNLTVVKNVTFNSTYFIEKEFQTDIVGDIENLINFRTVLNIAIPCNTSNSVYSPRSAGCPATCVDPSAPLDCTLPDVYDSCVCPRGYLLFGDRCVQPGDCGCTYNNVVHPIGQTWLTDRCTVRKTCEKNENGIPTITSTASQSCPPGKQCTAENTCSACGPINPCRNEAECVETTNSSQILYNCKCRSGFTGANCELNIGHPGSCYFFGNSHLVTFDGLPLDFKSQCPFTLLQVSDTIVKLQTSQINTRTAVSYLDIVSREDSIRLAAEQNVSLVVYLNQSIITEPTYEGRDFKINYYGEYIALDMEGGLSILVNKFSVILTLQTSYKGKVKGMCGNFNDVTSDDLKTSSGSQLPLMLDGTAGASETQQVGNSYVDSNDIRMCNLPEPPSKPPCSYDVLTFGAVCKAILNPHGPLKNCSQYFSALVFNQTLRWCLSDTRDTCNPRVAEINIKFIYDVCLYFKPLPPFCALLNTDLNCQCSEPNTNFIQITSACPASCKNPNQPSQCKKADLINACSCSEGFLLFRGRCIPTETCGCFDDMGAAHQVGETWMSTNCTTKYRCNVGGSISQERFNCNKTCINGNCTACTNPIQCPNGKCFDTNHDPGYFCKCNPGYEATGTECKFRNVGYCLAYGDTHYETFDGLAFDYQGISRFLLFESKDPARPIRILTKNFRRKGLKVSWLDYVEIEFKGKTYRAQRRSNNMYSSLLVKLNDNNLVIPFTSSDGSFKIAFDGDAIRMTTNIGVSVLYMTMFRASLEVDFSFRSRVTGACGNFDGIPSNDLYVNGKDFRSLPDPGNALGNYFIVENGTDALSPNITSSVCQNDIDLFMRRCFDIGNSAGSFGECLKLINPINVQVMTNSCIFDVQQTCSSESVKIAYLTFARRCYYSLGVDVENSTELQCECKEPNTVCMARSTGCPATCSNPSSPDTCTLSDSILTCSCEPGRLLFNGKCVLPGECGCVYTDGRAFDIGESWLSDDCQMRLTCKSPNIYTSNVYRCPANKTCVSGACRACSISMCNRNGECAETNTTKGFLCKCNAGYHGPTCADGLVTAYYENTHCTTFDRANFDYVGVGLFLLVKSTKVTTSAPILVPFEIWVANIYMEEIRKVFYAKLVIIIIANYRIVIDRDGEGVNTRISIKVNDIIIDPPYKTDPFVIIPNGRTRVTFITRGGVICTYEAFNNSVIVSLPTIYKITNVTGLCGNFDGDGANDLRTSDGQNVSDSTDPGYEIGLSYTNMSQWYRNITSIPDLCKNQISMGFTLYHQCWQLFSPSSPLKPLIDQLGKRADVFLKDCISDANKFCDYATVCLTVQRIIRTTGGTFNWRSIFKCDVTCPSGFEFRPTAPGCLASCADPFPHDTCPLPDSTDGCTCPPTKLFFKFKCVDKMQCGCIDNSTGMSYEIGKSWWNAGCTKKLTCGVGGVATHEDIGDCLRGRCDRNRCLGCLENPCLNNGTCVGTSDDGDFFCRCPYGYYGRRCDGRNTVADITILIENGISICVGNQNRNCVTNFIQSVKDFLKTFVMNLVIGPQDIRVSVATFMSDVTLAWPLQQYSTLTSILSAIDFNLTLSFTDQPINLVNSIDSIIKLVTSPEVDMPGRMKILILLSDGGSNMDAFLAPTVYKKLADARIRVCAIGLSSKVKPDVLKTVCSLPKQINFNYFLNFGGVNMTMLLVAIKISRPFTTRPLNESLAQCSCYGDPHCLTFDGQPIDYQGTCKIEFASNLIPGSSGDFPPFSVHLKSVNRNSNNLVSWVQSLYIVYMGTEIKLSWEDGRSFAVVGRAVVDIPHSNADFTIGFFGSGLEFKAIGWEFYCGIDVKAFVKLPFELSTKVTGFCGNFDGVGQNDLRTKNGTDVSNLSDPGKEIGDSYIDYDDIENIPILDTCKAPTAVTPTCPDNMEPYRYMCRQLTNATGVFKECSSKLPELVQRVQNDCLFDLDHTCDRWSIESTISTFAKSCNDAGVFVENWRETLSLPCRCMLDRICLPRGSPCLPTIQNPDAPLNCPLPDTTDVCTCRPSEVIFNNYCKRPEETGCRDANGGIRLLKEAWLSDDCQLLHNCTSSRTISSERVSCPSQTTCINGKCSGCALMPCQNNGTCVEAAECQNKSPDNPGCYWIKISETKGIYMTPAPRNVSDLNSCFQACFLSTSPCVGINWMPSADPGLKCLLVPSLSSSSVYDSKSTQFLWICSDLPCTVGPTTSPPKPMYSCTCTGSFIGDNCETKVGKCILDSGLIFWTFDREKPLLFRTNCKTTLARSKDQFLVNIKNLPRLGSHNNTFSVPRLIEVEFGSKKMKIVIPEIGLPKLMLQYVDGKSFVALNPPFNGSDFTLNWRGNSLILRTSFGLAITASPFGGMSVEVTSRLAGQMEGMCGDFDGNPYNDYNASLIDAGHDVVQRYFVPDDEYADDSNCSIPALTREELNVSMNASRCFQVIDPQGVFGECIRKLDPVLIAALHQVCYLEVIVNEDERAACSFIERLLDGCNNEAGAVISADWRSALNCTCDCVDGFVCSSRASSCPITCSTPNSFVTCPEVQDICVCPSGQVLFNDRCVFQEQCGCLESGIYSRDLLTEWLNEDCSVMYKCHWRGDISSSPNVCPPKSICNNSKCSTCSVNNPCKRGTCVDQVKGEPICRCPPGYTGKNCEIDNLNACMFFGLGHCLTFDGVELNYVGDCKIILVQSMPPLPPFRVMMKNYIYSDYVSYPNYVEIEIGGDVVAFTQWYLNIIVTLNQSTIQIPVVRPTYKINFRGQKAVLQTIFGLTVSLMDPMIRIDVPQNMSRSLRGLCGNFNNDKNDDRTTRGGSTGATDQQIADSFIELGISPPDRCLPASPSTTIFPPPTTLPYTSTASTQQSNPTCSISRFEDWIGYCEIFSNSSTMFGQCLHALNSTMPHIAKKILSFTTYCKSDLAKSCTTETVYYYVKFLASSCSEIGFTIDWVNKSIAAYLCPSGSTYTFGRKSPCPQTCHDPDTSYSCPWNDMGGFCVCKPGYVLHAYGCMPRQNCGCHSSLGEYRVVGETWYEDSCFTRKTCIGPGDTATTKGNGTCRS